LIGKGSPVKSVVPNHFTKRSKPMPTNHLYHTWFQRIRELRPEQRVTQIRNFVWLMIGIYQSRSVCLSRIASKVPGSAKLLSMVRRLSRLLDNPAIRVRDWYEAIAQQWLTAQFRHHGEIHLIVDGTKIGFGHQLLIICLAYRRRAIPLAWTWVKHAKGHSSASKPLALLAYVRQLIPMGAAVFLVGDCEFGSVAILRQLDSWHWFYVLRQKTDTGVWFDEKSGWHEFGSCLQEPGQSLWLGKGYLTAKEIYPVNLLALWKINEKEPWCLATNLPDRQMALRFYKRRMWIEETFGDMKKHGFDLECTMLRHFLRLSRLTLAVALLYVWLMSVGTQTIHNGSRHLVDRHDRRDLCVFQIGLRFIERQLVNALSICLPLLCVYQ
jgi:hypothetical protein